MGAWGQRVIAGVGTPEADPRKREREGHVGHQGPRRACLPTVSLLKNLKHANIVTLHDLVHTERSLTLVFEYLVSWALLTSPLWWEGRGREGMAQALVYNQVLRCSQAGVGQGPRPRVSLESGTCPLPGLGPYPRRRGFPPGVRTRWG